MEKTMVLAGGCFWGLEAYFHKYDGIVKTEVGYANGLLPNPVYDQVKKGGTGYAEAVYVTYNTDQMSTELLLEKFWQVIDPTVLNRQGPDLGHQYRTGIYYTDPSDLEAINTSKTNAQKAYEKPIVTEIEPLKNYYTAEDYHQDYLTKNPNGYCHIDLSLYD